MKKNIFKLLTVLFAVTLTISNVYADKVVEAGDTVIQEGEYDSLRLAAGNKVTNKANIDGLSFVAGNDLYLEGSAPYGFFAGNNIIVNEKIEKDIFIAGNDISIESDAVIGRDAYIAGNKVVIKANIARNLRAGGTSIDLSGITVNGDAYIAAEKVILDENTVINGKLSYYEDGIVKGLDEATVGSVKVLKSKEVTINYDFKTKVYEFIFSVISAFATAAVLFYLLPNSKEKLDKLDLSIGMVAKTACIGFVVLIAAPIIIMMAMVTGFLTPLSFIALAIYIIAIYLSSILVYYIVGKVINEKLIHNNSKYLSLLIGIVLVKLIRLIPIIGWYIGVVIIFYGLGLIFDYLKNIRN